MKTLSGLDGAFLHLETKETPMHVASLHLFELPPGFKGDFHAAVRREMQRRIPLAPALTRKLAPMPLDFANPAWVQADQLEMDYHVQHVTLPAPGTQDQLEDYAGRLHSELLDRSRPLWRIAVIDGLRSGKVAYYVQVHHAVLDGMAGVLLARVLFDPTATPRTLPQPPTLQAEVPGRAALAAAAIKHDAGQVLKLMQHLPEVAKTLVDLVRPEAARATSGLSRNFSFGPKTPLNGPITGERGFAAASIPLDRLKALAKAHDGTLNDIVLALCSGMLRRYLARHGGIPAKSLMATMPISLREAGNTDITTQAMLSLVNLNTRIANPAKRLAAIRADSATMKSLALGGRSIIPTDFPSFGIPWLLQGLAAIYGRWGLARALPPIANVAISNVPGPAQPLYLAGARMTDYWPLSIVEHGLGLNITVLSYAGTMGFGFTAARASVPDAHELPTLLHEALEELAASPAPQSRIKRAQP